MTKAMAQTRAVLQQRPANINFDLRRLVFVEQFLRNDKSDGADKSSPVAETSKH